MLQMGVPLSRARLSEINRVIGRRLRAAREQAGWTLEDLAGKSGIAVATLHRYESGKRVHRSAALVMIANTLGIDAGELIKNLSATDSPKRVRRQVTDRLAHTPEQRELIEIYVALPAAERALGLEFFRLLASRVHPRKMHPRKR